MISTHKVCTKCGEPKLLAQFTIRSSGRVEAACKKCRATKKKYDDLQRFAESGLSRGEWNKLEYSRRKEYFQQHEKTPQARKRAKEYYHRNSKARVDAYRAWAVANPDRVLELKNKDSKRATEKLTDYYVASKLKIPVKDAPPELIEAKRAQLMIHRFITRGASK